MIRTHKPASSTAPSSAATASAKTFSLAFSMIAAGARRPLPVQRMCTEHPQVDLGIPMIAPKEMTSLVAESETAALLFLPARCGVAKRSRPTATPGLFQVYRLQIPVILVPVSCMQQYGQVGLPACLHCKMQSSQKLSCPQGSKTTLEHRSKHMQQVNVSVVNFPSSLYIPSHSSK